jgi:plasmid stability protein
MSTTQDITISIPDLLYKKLKARAEQTQRSVEVEALDALVASLPVIDELSPDLEDSLAQLSFLDDKALWRAARTTFPADAARQLEDLHLKRQRDGLTEHEAQTAAALLQQYERTMLVRAQSTALLKGRGHDDSPLLQELK